jgi:hypothetical protein
MISVELPADLYERIRRVAARSDRSVENILIESLEVLFGMPPSEEKNLAAILNSYRDEQLWAVVYQRFAWTDNERLRELTAKGKQGSLTPAEQSELEALIDRLDRYTLLRSQALRLLQQRGHDVDAYLHTGV